MIEGMLWFDDHPGRTLEQKVRRAVDHYKHKHCRFPDVCYVHPSALEGEGDVEVEGVQVKPGRSILPHHFWLGEEEHETQTDTGAEPLAAAGLVQEHP
jgi:hypothetical protein